MLIEKILIKKITKQVLELDLISSALEARPLRVSLGTEIFGLGISIKLSPKLCE